MNQTKTINHLFFIDTSTASTGQRRLVQEQVNDMLDSIRNSHIDDIHSDHLVTAFLFENNNLRCFYHQRSIQQIAHFVFPGEPTKKPGPVLDALATSIATWRAMNREGRNQNYHVTIFSPVRDSGSRKYSECTLKSIITSLKENRWNFTLINETPLISNLAKRLGISNYYICRKSTISRDRNFMIRQLQRQWLDRQLDTSRSNEDMEYAA